MLSDGVELRDARVTCPADHSFPLLVSQALWASASVAGRDQLLDVPVQCSGKRMLWSTGLKYISTRLWKL